MPQDNHDWGDYLEIAALSDVGMRRSNNQDSKVIDLAGDGRGWIERGHVFVVADGMGAHAAGELASKMAVDNIPHTYKKLVDMPAPLAIRKSIVDTNALIHGRGQSNPDFKGMGTTCSTLILVPQGALVAHVGDSRIYRLRNHTFEQLTFDHSLVWEMLATGQMAEGDMAGVVPKNVITRSLGPNAKVQVDLEGPFPIEPGDAFLLCSDGLSGQLRDEEIGVILDSLPVVEAVQTMVDLANLRGGPDNITVIAVRVKQPKMATTADMPSGDDLGGGGVHPVLWAALGCCLLAALGLQVLGMSLMAALFAVGGLVAGGVAALQWMEKKPRRGVGFAGGPFGKGPHRSYSCEATVEQVGKFSETVEKLRSAASKDGWHIDWQTFDGYANAGGAAAENNQHAEAVAQYSHAIRFMLAQLRSLQAQAKQRS